MLVFLIFFAVLALLGFALLALPEERDLRRPN
jgi:hypothetical protein